MGLCSMHYSRKLRGMNMDEPSRKRGQWTGVDGYVRVLVPGHPAAMARGYVLEHRLVMEEMLGRILLPYENVHHKNGIRDDNRPENLELWARKQPAGQRAEDLLDWAYEIIERYGDMPRSA